MLIDWFTVGAQVLNFLVLVWLLKHFLYKPILNAIDAREKRIAAELASAAIAKADAQKDRDEFQQKNQKFDAERAALMKKATDDANAERQHRLDDAAKAADATSKKQQDAMRSEADSLRTAIARRAQQEVFAIAREALNDLCGTALEQQIVDVFILRLRAMNGDDKKNFGEALKSSPTPSIVRTAFDLPADLHAAVQTAINQTFSADIHLTFEIAPAIVAGIELTAGGHKLAWSIADYLTSLHTGIDELVAGQKAVAPSRPASAGSPVVATANL